MESDQGLYLPAPQSVGRVLDAGFRLFRAGFMTVLPLSIANSLIINLPQFAQVLIGTQGASILAASAVLALYLVCAALYLAGFLGLLVAQDAIARGAPAPSLTQCFSIGFGRFWTALGAGALYVLALLIGFVLLVVPGLILMISLGLVWTLVALERQGAIESLKASHHLVWGHWWRTSAVFMVAILVYYIPSLLVGSIIGFIAASSEVAAEVEGLPGVNLVTLLVLVSAQTVVSALLLPLLNAISLAQFNDLKLRRSGSDLLARASA